MLECLIMGDSIAVGIGTYQKQCITAAKVGINSQAWYNSYKEAPVFKHNNYKTAVISLSTNDFHKTETADVLYSIRYRIKADRVVWILPSHTLRPVQRAIIREIANEFKDTVIDITQFLGPDNIHPTGKGYISIGNNILKK